MVFDLWLTIGFYTVLSILGLLQGREGISRCQKKMNFRSTHIDWMSYNLWSEVIVNDCNNLGNLCSPCWAWNVSAKLCEAPTLSKQKDRGWVMILHRHSKTGTDGRISLFNLHFFGLLEIVDMTHSHAAGAFSVLSWSTWSFWIFLICIYLVGLFDCIVVMLYVPILFFHFCDILPWAIFSFPEDGFLVLEEKQLAVASRKLRWNMGESTFFVYIYNNLLKDVLM